MRPVVRTAPARVRSRMDRPRNRPRVMFFLLCSSLFPASGSVGEARRLAEVGVVCQLVQHELGDVGARDLEPQPLLGGREAVPVLARALAVGEGCWTDYRPLQGATPDVRFLLLVVREGTPQQEPEHDVLPKEVEVARTLPDTEGGLADETPHACPHQC